ncbi:MAG: hypothetical protein ABI612_11735 [Betaproteobacteria bacterium]
MENTGSGNPEKVADTQRHDERHANAECPWSCYVWHCRSRYNAMPTMAAGA